MIFKYWKCVGVLFLLGALGCESQMATSRYRLLPSSFALNGKYSLTEVECTDRCRVSADLIKHRLEQQGIFSLPAENVLPIKIYVDQGRVENANGFWANLNNLLGGISLMVWPVVESKETKFEVKVVSALGTDRDSSHLIERKWMSLSPIAFLPVPGWADARGEDVQEFPVEVICSDITKTLMLWDCKYEDFFKNPKKYAKQISEEASRDALEYFLKTVDADKRIEWINKVNDETVISESQEKILKAYKGEYSEEVRKALIKRMTNTSVATLAYSPLLLTRLDAVQNQEVLAKLCAYCFARNDRETGDEILARITDPEVWIAMVRPVSGNDSRLYLEKQNEAKNIDKRLRSMESLLEASRGDASPAAGRETETEQLQSAIVRLQRARESILATAAECMYLPDESARSKVYLKIRQHGARDILKSMVRAQTLELWNKQDVSQFEAAIDVAKGVGDESLTAFVVAQIFEWISDLRKRCEKEIRLFWGSQDKELEQKVLAQVRPALTDNVMELALLQNGRGWEYLVPCANRHSALRLLQSGRLAYVYLEVELAKKLTADDISIDLYKKARSSQLRKILLAKMSRTVREQVDEMNGRTVEALLKKAEKMSQKTFALKGFYLGMPVADAEVLIRSYWPGSSVNITDEYVDVDVTDKSVHKMHFCDVANDKVVRLNFEMRILAKWFRYDAQTSREWAQAFARDHAGVRFVRERLYGEKRIDAGLVSVRQEAYRYKSYDKGYMLTCFGEKDVTDLSDNLPHVTIDFNNPLSAFGAGFQEGVRKILKNWPNEGWENEKGAREGTLRIEALTEDD